MDKSEWITFDEWMYINELRVNVDATVTFSVTKLKTEALIKSFLTTPVYELA